MTLVLPPDLQNSLPEDEVTVNVDAFLTLAYRRGKKTNIKDIRDILGVMFPDTPEFSSADFSLEVVSKLGEGTYGVVYEARIFFSNKEKDKEMKKQWGVTEDQTFALKLIHASFQIEGGDLQGIVSTYEDFSISRVGTQTLLLRPQLAGTTNTLFCVISKTMEQLLFCLEFINMEG